MNHHRWKAQRERYMNHFSSIMLYQKVESGEKSREKGWNSDKHFNYDVEPHHLINH